MLGIKLISASLYWSFMTFNMFCYTLKLSSFSSLKHLILKSSHTLKISKMFSPRNKKFPSIMMTSIIKAFSIRILLFNKGFQTYIIGIMWNITQNLHQSYSLSLTEFPTRSQIFVLGIWYMIFAIHANSSKISIIITIIYPLKIR